jgi:hypothetical protein
MTTTVHQKVRIENFYGRYSAIDWRVGKAQDGNGLKTYLLMESDEYGDEVSSPVVYQDTDGKYRSVADDNYDDIDTCLQDLGLAE